MNEAVKVPDQVPRLKGTVRIQAYKAGTKEKVGEEVVFKNLVMQAANVGLDLIVQRILGINTYTLNVTYGAIGTSGTAPAITDTQLGTEYARAVPSLSNDVNNSEAQFQFYFTDTVLNSGGTLTVKEFGLFVDGGSGANSGQLLCHALFAPSYTKAAGTDITVEYDLTF